MNIDQNAIEEQLLLIVNTIKSANLQLKDLDCNMEKLGIFSIEFIKVVVECEKKWGIEFDMEKLDRGSHGTLRHVAEYVANCIHNHKIT